MTENGLFYTVDDFENTLKLTIQHTKAEMNEFGMFCMKRKQLTRFV